VSRAWQTKNWWWYTQHTGSGEVKSTLFNCQMKLTHPPLPSSPPNLRSDVEPEEKGRFNFKQLDELLGKCADAGLEVCMVVGMKGPRWPEFHIPQWATPMDPEDGDADEDISRDQQLCADCLDYVETVVNHVQGMKCIVAWQVENEPMDRAGERRQIVGLEFVAAEATLIRRIDKQLRPIVITAWCWSFKHDSDVKDAIRHSNILGLDVYSKVRGDDTTGEKRCRMLPSHYSQLANSKGRGCWITELQAEPWNPSTFDANDMESLLEKVREFDTIFLWGFEKWLDLRNNRDEHEMWEAVKIATAKHLQTKR
jgi:hypothetical protein